MRNLCITLLLLLVVSNAMIGVHVVTHVSAEPSECELCTAYGDPGAAVPTTGLLMPVEYRPSEAAHFPATPKSTLCVSSCHPRGPPSLV